MEANYVHKDSTTLVQDELVKNELNQIELQYNALKQQKFNELLKENQEMENQQKEFINYLEDEIKRLKENDIYEPLQRMALATHQHNLSKYKEIIGDINDKK